MTGFGNFTYYYRTGDFHVGRFAQMMWRLNFLVFFACAALGNSYMLYYICPMHTLYTVFVYGSLALAPGLNKSPGWLAAKMVACFAAVALMWEIKPVFYALWRPLAFLVGYSDPRRPATDVLDGAAAALRAARPLRRALHPPLRRCLPYSVHVSLRRRPILGADPASPGLPPRPCAPRNPRPVRAEWYFRSGLDRYVWIHGMVCAYAHPYATRALERLDALAPAQAAGARAALLAACAAVGAVYHRTVFSLPKVEYNALHPFTSWVPITLWIVVRNCAPGLRIKHLRLYGWLGCITLETYISQFHVWLRTDVPDGQPKAVLNVLPGYPLLNFAVVTAGYVWVSHRLFELTNTLKSAALPSGSNAKLARAGALLAAWAAVAWCAGAGVKALAGGGARQQ
jgi:hypothetical protein